MSFPRKVNLSPLIRCWIYPGSKPEHIFYATPKTIVILSRKKNGNKVNGSSF